MWVENDDSAAPPPPGPGQVNVKIRGAPCTPADLRTMAAAATAVAPSATVDNPGADMRTPPTMAPPTSPSPLSASPPLHLRDLKSPLVGGSEGLWEVTAAGEGVSDLRPGDLAVPVPAAAAATDGGTWRAAATLDEASLVKVPATLGGDGGSAIGAGGRGAREAGGNEGPKGE
ncbi:unnamed protein product, partial [Scytosiphon promiscuus]